MTDHSHDSAAGEQGGAPTSILIHEHGPYEVVGTGIQGQSATIATDEHGTSISYTLSGKLELKPGDRLCRCGDSANKPWCDGSHERTQADMTLTAATDPYSAHPDVVAGPQLTLHDDESLCSYARFCDAGERVWTEVTLEGEKHVDLVESVVRHCPGGRLLVADRSTGKMLDIVGERGVSFIEDPVVGVHGPIMVVGGVPVQAEGGHSYAVRANQALCRCGRSSNKPFCDGSHAATEQD